MEKVIKRQKLVHYAASMIGGFWGGYTIFNHVDIFANAQTGNLIKMVLEMCEGKFNLVAFMLLGFLIYCGGNVFYVLVRRKTKLSMKIISLICSAAAVILIGSLPFIRSHYVACYPIVFVAPIQWNAFKIAGGNSSSTIFSSNNVRQAAILTTNFALNKDRRTGRSAAFYWLTLLSFQIGAALAGSLSVLFGTMSIWFCFAPILLTAVAYYFYQKGKINSNDIANT